MEILWIRAEGITEPHSCCAVWDEEGEICNFQNQGKKLCMSLCHVSPPTLVTHHVITVTKCEEELRTVRLGAIKTDAANNGKHEAPNLISHSHIVSPIHR